MKILWTNRALDDFKQNISYIANDSPKNAQKVLETLINLIETLKTFPYAYPVEPVYNKKGNSFYGKMELQNYL